MTFTYTLTCTLDTTTALPPVAGSEEQRAYWVTPTILAWPLSLLPRGMDREVVVTDTLPIPESKRFENLTVLPIAPLLARAIKAVFDDGSVTRLFDSEGV